MKISVVIPLYSRVEWLKKNLAALARQKTGKDLNFEVNVVDDGSPNGADINEAVRSFSDSLTIRCIRQERKGPAAAKNTGIRASTGEIICFLDDDSVCCHEWLSEIAAAFTKDTRASLVSGRTLSYFRQPGSFALLLERSVYKRQKRWATCNIAYRREVFERLGMFDERFRQASWEDNDLGFRAVWIARLRHAYCPEALVYHAHESSLGEFMEKSVRNGEGFRQFFLKFIRVRPFECIAISAFILKDLLLVVNPAVVLDRKASSLYARYVWARNTLKGFMHAVNM